MFSAMLRLVRGYNMATLYMHMTHICKIKKQKTKKRQTIPLAYNILDKNTLFSTLAIFDMTVELFFSAVQSKHFHPEDQLDNQSIPFQKSLLFLAKTNKQTDQHGESVKKKRKKETKLERVLALDSIQALRGIPEALCTAESASVVHQRERVTPIISPM